MSNVLSISTRPTILAGVALAAIAYAVPVHAQRAEVRNERAAKADSLLPEIVVTARRREERLQDVPVAITAITAEELAVRGINELNDLTQTASGLTIQASSHGQNVPSFAMRGQSQTSPYMTVDPSVGIYFADVPIARSHGANAALFDLESVQLLKGPQGTLFGRNTTGGAVLIRPKTPGDTLGGYLKAGYGKYQAQEYEGALDIPVADFLKLRLSGRIVKSDGFARNLFNGTDLYDQNNQSWRATVVITPVEALRNELIVNGFRADENGVGMKLTQVRPGGTLISRFPAVINELSPTRPFRTVNVNQPPDSTYFKTLTLANTTTLDLSDSLTLKNIFGYRKVRGHSQTDLDGSPFPMLIADEAIDQKQVSNELQLQGKLLDGNLDFILGAFYFREKGDDVQDVNVLGIIQQQFAGRDIRNTNYSVFSQATYRIPSIPSLSVTLGGRYSRDKKVLNLQNTSNGGCQIVSADTGGVPLNPCTVALDKPFSKFTYNVSVDWKPTSQTLLYAAYRTGFRSGGFNIAANFPSQFAPFKPENVKSLEVGAKADWRIGDIQVRSNLSLFRDSYTDIQRTVAIVGTNNTVLATIVNAASARVQGGELEVNIEPVKHLRIDTNIAYVDPKYKSFVDQVQGDLSNQKFTYAPKTTVRTAVSWDAPIGETTSLFAQVSMYYQAKVYTSPTNKDAAGNDIIGTALPAFTTYDARVELRNLMTEGLTLGLYARNFTNKKYYIGGIAVYSSSLGFAGSYLGAPRTIGADLTYRF